MGAAMTQHPELFSAIVCGYPLLDMLRYQKFKVGSYWTTEYGSADNQKQFPYLLKYSPYQNVKVSTAYPAVMFFTGDSDTRVDPLHARKMTALHAVGLKQRPAHSAPLQPRRRPLGGRQRGPGDPGRRRPAPFLWTETETTPPAKAPVH